MGTKKDLFIAVNKFSLVKQLRWIIYKRRLENMKRLAGNIAISSEEIHLYLAPNKLV